MQCLIGSATLDTVMRIRRESERTFSFRVDEVFAGCSATRHFPVPTRRLYGLPDAVLRLVLVKRPRAVCHAVTSGKRCTTSIIFCAMPKQIRMHSQRRKKTSNSLFSLIHKYYRELNKYEIRVINMKVMRPPRNCTHHLADVTFDIFDMICVYINVSSY